MILLTCLTDLHLPQPQVTIDWLYLLQNITMESMLINAEVTTSIIIFIFSTYFDKNFPKWCTIIYILWGCQQKLDMNGFFLTEYDNYNGWYPAILNSQDELDFIRYAQKGLINETSYWIGGSSDISPITTIEFSNYNDTNAGNSSYWIGKSTNSLNFIQFHTLL